jgi:uncharacterized protein (DUF885 family)
VTAGSDASDVSEASPPGRVEALATRFWEGFLERQPTYATFLGDERYDDRLEDAGPAGREAEARAYADVLESGGTIDRDALDIESRITLDMLEVVARIGQAQLDQHFYQLASMDQMVGPQVLPGELARVQRADTPERLDRLIARLERYPAFLEQHADNLREGIVAGRTAARPVVERVIEQTRRAVEAPIEEAPLLAVLQDPSSDERDRLRRVLEEVVRPAQAGFLGAVEEYAPHARSGDGLWSLADGAEIYRTAILASTTIEADAQELHDYGLALLETIEGERQAIARELGERDSDGVRALLASSPSNIARAADELTRLAEAQIERAASAAPRWFGRQPQADCVVRAVEPFHEQEAPPAFYLPPAVDGSRPGIYYVNTFQPQSRPLHQLAARTFHEAIPGHHFQIALEWELEELPPFRRHGSRLVGVAYGEGWGLYSERLADEMGLYAGPLERWGMLDAQAWRAARLVVDTGIHAFRWDRQRSIDLLVGIGLSALEAETETDRYISWPGQALAYMVGQREISALRRQLAERDGDGFDLRAFHDEMLGHGALPLATLRRELPVWLSPPQVSEPVAR